MGLRRDGREAAVQYLFARDLHPGGEQPSEQEIHGFWELHSAKPGARKFAEALTKGVLQHLEPIDECLMRTSTNFTVERLADVDRNILRLGIYELMHVRDLSPSIIINEAIEIAKKFGAPESAKFVNGVLDKIAREVRTAAPAKANASASKPAEA